MADKQVFRNQLNALYQKYEELFPKEMRSGYHLHDCRVSKKMTGLQMRRIKLKEVDAAGKGIVLTIQPSFVMPYMTGMTQEVEKALFLTQYGVPLSALTYVFGRNDQYWYRQLSQFGRYGLVETTIQQREKMPKHLLADEKHSRINGEKCYIATTCGDDCVLGVSISTSADETGLMTAYRDFKEESVAFDSEYAPETVNTDGWMATQKAWLTLFTTVTIIECFLHAFIAIRSRCKKKLKAFWPQIQDHVWNIYKAVDQDSFVIQVEQFHTWAHQHIDGSALKAIDKLCQKADRFVRWYDHPQARRTSNMLDRLMIPMDRWLFHRRYFHGHLISAEKSIRSWALIKNFSPYSPRSKLSKDWLSPAHKLNGKVYHENWLHNLLISTSTSPVVTFSHKKQQN